MSDLNFYEQASIVDLLDHVLIQHNHELYGGLRKKSPLRPSSAGRCTRALAYEYEEYHKKLLPVVEQKEGNVVRLLNLGGHVERALISDLYKMKDKLGIQVKYRDQILTCGKLKDGTIIQGEIDLALEGDNFKILADVKSTKVKYSSHFKDSWKETTAKWAKSKHVKVVSPTCYLVEDTYKFYKDLGADFKVMNIAQLNLYAHSHFFEERGYEYCSLLYYLKNTSEMYELRFKKCKKLYKETMEKYQQAYDAGQGKPEEAPKTWHFGSIFCAFCPYKDRCWSEETDPKYAYFQTLPKKRWPKDIDRVKDSEKLEKLFDKYEKVLDKTEEAGKLELEIAKALYEQKVSKIKLANENVWEVKLLKSQGLVLRRSKI